MCSPGAVSTAESFQRYADESVVITGDDNLADVLATVHYSIRNVRVYLFEVGDPEAALRQATEAALRDVAAGQGLCRPAHRPVARSSSASC